jgi:hypothetical protein
MCLPGHTVSSRAIRIPKEGRRQLPAFSSGRSRDCVLSSAPRFRLNVILHQ